MNYTNTSGTHYRIALAIHQAERPLSIDEIATAIRHDCMRGLRTMIGRMCFEGDLEKRGECFALTVVPRRHFNAKFAVLDSVAESRKMIPFRPLRRELMLERIHAGRIRTDVRFLTSSQAYPGGSVQ